MKIPLLLTILFFTCATTAISARAADAGDLTGNYRCKGSNYEGTVTISTQGDAYRVNWVIGAREKYSGVGLVQDGVLAVAYYGRAQGIVAYRIEADGQLVGRWTMFDKPGAVSVETLTKVTN